MQSLKNELLLYHGSYTEITSIDLSKSRKSLDFGAGFYLTSSFEQARNYVPSTVKKNIRRRKLPKDFDVNDGRISVYRFHFNDLLRIRNFNTADLEWLHFIASNRDDSLFCELGQQYQDYDVIIGKVADDSTAATLNSYITGEYGLPGSPRADQFAIEQLLPNRLTDQFCFRTEKALESLEFVRSVRYGDLL